MKVIIREEETRGELDARLLALELSLFNRWEKWFGKNPGSVLGIVIAALFASFWYYHTYQIDRLDRNHLVALTELRKIHQDKMNWLKETHNTNLSTAKERCDIENERANNKLLQCETNTNNHGKSLNQTGEK